MCLGSFGVGGKDIVFWTEKEMRLENQHHCHYPHSLEQMFVAGNFKAWCFRVS
jgi:hypothetical protein